MFVTLLVATCLNLADPSSCASHKVADTAADPALDSIQACFGIEGQSLAAKWLEANPDQKLKGLSCQFVGGPKDSPPGSQPQVPPNTHDARAKTIPL